MRDNSWKAIFLVLFIIAIGFFAGSHIGYGDNFVTSMAIEDNGTLVGARPILNIAGTSVNVSEDVPNNRITIDVSGAAGAPANLSYITATSEAGLDLERVLTGTADQITITDNGGVTGTIVASIAGTYVGQNTITTVGTIGTGVWQGTAIADTYIADDVTLTNITQITNRSHTNLTDIGSNSHAAIDTHIADGTIHFTQANITATGTIASGTWQGTTIKQPYISIGTGAGDANTLTLHDFAVGTPTDNYILKWDAGGGNWTWEADQTGGAGTTHELLSATHTDTTTGTVLRGDLITGQGASPTWTRLTKGTSGQYLRSDGTDLAWSGLLDSDIPSSLTRDTEWDTQGEVETIWGTTLATDTELSGKLGTGLTSAYIFVGNVSNLATGVAMSGDITIDNTGATTIGADKVALSTDTTGTYVGSVAAGSGIGISGTPGENYTATVALGALTADWDQSGAFDIILNNQSSQLKILEAGATPTLYGIFTIADLTTGDKTYTFPNASGTVFTSGNVVTTVGDADNLSLHDLVTGTPTTNYIPKWNGTNWTWSEDLTGGGSSHALLSATHTDTAAGTPVLGGIIAANATPTWQQVAGNTTSTQKFLAQTGTGAVSALPGWVTIADGDIPDILSITKISNLTTNGFVKTGSGDGTLSIDTSTYLTAVTAHNLFSATHGDTVAASPVLGDIIYGNVTPAWTKLTGNTTTTKKFLTQTGTGAVSAAPTWNGIADGDLPSALTGKTYNGLTVTTSAGTLTIANNASAALVTSGNFSITLIATNTTSVTLPTSGTLSTLALESAGTNGTAAANAGDDTTASRSDHEHYVYRELVFFYSGTLATGDPGIWIRLDEAGASGDIISAYGVLATDGTTSTTIDILKCSQTNIDGTPSWSTIFTNKLLFDANESSTNTASTAPSLSVTSWTANDHFRLNVDTAGTSAANATIKMKIRVKTKAS